MFKPKGNPDNLAKSRRRELVSSLRRSIENQGFSEGKRVWSIPNTSKAGATLETYRFPEKKPRIWMAYTKFPAKNKTRDAFLVALSVPAHDSGDPIRTTYEFNVGVRPSNRMNFRFQEGDDGEVIVRCRCSFAWDAVRRASQEFFGFAQDRHPQFVKRNREFYQRKEFINLIKLPGADISSSWNVLWPKLAMFGGVVDDFKANLSSR